MAQEQTRREGREGWWSRGLLGEADHFPVGKAGGPKARGADHREVSLCPAMSIYAAGVTIMGTPATQNWSTTQKYAAGVTNFGTPAAPKTAQCRWPAARRRGGRAAAEQHGKRRHDGARANPTGRAGRMVEPRAPGRSRPFSGRRGQRPEGAGGRHAEGSETRRCGARR